MLQGCGSAFTFCGSRSSSLSECRSGSSCLKNADPDPAQTNFFFFITLRRVFFSCKRHCSKVRNNEDCANLLLNLNKLQLKPVTLPIFLHLLSFYLTIFPSWFRIGILNADPYPEVKMNVDPCRSGSTALVCSCSHSNS